MSAAITTIQDITLDAYVCGVYDILDLEYFMPRDDIFAIFQNWAEEFEIAHKKYIYDGDYYDELSKFLEKKKEGLKQGA